MPNGELPQLLQQVKALLDAADVAPKGRGNRVCQETKPQADIGWKLELGIPDAFIPVADGHVLLRYDDVLVDMEAVTDGITYAEMKAKLAEKAARGTA